MSDVWTTGDENDNPETALYGPIGDGISVNQAFSIDIVFRHAMAIIRQQPVVMYVGGLLLFFITIVVPQGTNYGVQYTVSLSSLEPAMQQGLTSGWQLGFGLLMAIPAALITAGVIHASAKYIATGQVALGDLFGAGKAALRLILAQIVVSLAMMAAMLIVLTPMIAGAILLEPSPMILIALILLVTVVSLPIMIYVALGLQLFPYIIVIDGRGPLEAIGISWRAARGARLTLFINVFAVGMISLVLYLSCCLLIGFILAPIIMPLILAGLHAAYTASWLMVARRPEQIKEWGYFQEEHIPPW